MQTYPSPHTHSPYDIERQIFRKVEYNLTQNHNQEWSDTSLTSNKVMMIYTGGLLTQDELTQGNSALPALIKHFKTHQTLVDLRATYLLPNNKKWLATPSNDEQKRLYYTILELKGKDKHYRGYDLWVKIAETIKTHYDDFHGFVIIHEIPDLDYTASALSFMLQNLRKTVILTSGVIELKSSKSDALKNVGASINIAGTYLIPEVSVFFNEKLLRGNRVLLYESDFLNPFDTPNYPILGKYNSLGLSVNWEHVKGLAELSSDQKFGINTKISRELVHVENFPLSADSMFESTLLSKRVKGVVIELFGIGNVQSNRPR
jgi:hypothetical protein